MMTTKIARIGRTATAACAVGAFAIALPVQTLAETEQAEPDAFLEYIEATGSQYIDTGVNAETGLKSRIDIEIGSYSGNADWGILDAATVANSSDNRSRIFMCHLYSYKPFFGYGLTQRGNPNGTFNLDGGKRYEIVTDMTDTNSLELVQNGKNTFSDGDRAKYAVNGNNVNLHLNLFIFATNYGGDPTWPGKGKLYELKIWKKNAETDNLDLIRHYLPCIKNGRAGLYDKVNGTISYSDGSAELVAGPVLDKPLDYVKWIWGNGKQWFDTRVWGKSGLKSEIDISLREYSGDCCILGCRGGHTSNTRVYLAYHYEKLFRYAYGTMCDTNKITKIAPTNDVSYYMDTRYLIKSDIRKGFQSVTVSKNGAAPVELHTEGQDYLSSDFVATNTLWLLTNNKIGASANPSKALIYATKIWDGDELLRDFVPVVATNSEGVAYAGLYDMVSERIFRQIGTAEFDLDSQVGGVTNSLRTIVAKPETRLEYIDSDALLDYVDLGIIGKDGVEMDATMEWLRVPNDGAFVGARHNDETGAHRFFLYHYWHDSNAGSRHRLCYDSDLFAIGSSPATANVKYRIVSRLDVGRGDMSISAFTDGAWRAVVSRTVLPENGYDGPVDTGLPLYLFAMNLDGTPRFHGKVRLYRLKLSEKQLDGSYALARDFVPVNDPLTGGVALWDKVTETYFRNGGKYRLAGGGNERPMNVGTVIAVK